MHSSSRCAAAEILPWGRRLVGAWRCQAGRLLLAGAVFGLPSAEAIGQRFAAAGDVTVTLATTRGQRSAIVHLPPRFRERGELPVLVAFHGGGGNAAGFRRYARLDAIADRRGFVVVYPNGTGRVAGRLLTWNAGGCCGFAQRSGVDDVGFVWSLLGDLAADLPLDAHRVYLTGHSNGAMMAYRVAAESAPRVAALAAVAGAMNLAEFAPRAPVPVLHIHSIDDPRALYRGGLGPPFPLTRYRVRHHAVETELRRWARRNGCQPEPHEIERRSAAAGTHVHEATLLGFDPCSSGDPVWLWRLEGPGHGWPGSPGALPERLVGPSTTVLDAGAEVWHFVSRFKRPGAPPLAQTAARRSTSPTDRYAPETGPR